MDIALARGFSDQSHFTRSFRHVVGMRPGVWRCTSIGGAAQGCGGRRKPWRVGRAFQRGELYVGFAWNFRVMIYPSDVSVRDAV
jgi:AraC-like DNA-binding protein